MSIIKYEWHKKIHIDAAHSGEESETRRGRRVAGIARFTGEGQK